MGKTQAEQILYKISDRLNAIDIAVEKNEKLLIKVIHQTNELFKAFVVMNDVVYGVMSPNKGLEKEPENFSSPLYIKEYEDMARAICERLEEFEKFEEEMERFKYELTPGTMGEA